MGYSAYESVRLLTVTTLLQDSTLIACLVINFFCCISNKQQQLPVGTTAIQAPPQYRIDINFVAATSLAPHLETSPEQTQVGTYENSATSMKPVWLPTLFR